MAALATQSGHCILHHSSTHSEALYFFVKRLQGDED